MKLALGVAPSSEPWRGAFPPLAFAIALALLCAPGVAPRHALAAVPVSVPVAGEVAKPYRLTPEILAKLPRVSVRVTLEKGGMATYEGVALSDILARAGVRFGQALHGGGIARYLKVDAADRYQVVFALAELDTAYASRVVLLADRKDGRPLPEPEGPLEVIVPGEKIRARWVWKVSALTVESAR